MNSTKHKLNLPTLIKIDSYMVSWSSEKEIKSHNYVLITKGHIAIHAISRLIVLSHKIKKKQHAYASSGPRNHISKFFIHMAALKYANTVTKPPP